MELILVQGKPGCGKSSASEAVVSELRRRHGIDAVFVSVGDRLRAIRAGTVTSKFAEQVTGAAKALSSGRRVTDDLVTAVVDEFLTLRSSSQVLIVDGYPKYRQQLDPFECAVARASGQIRGVVYMDLPDELAVGRIVRRGSRIGEQASAQQFARDRIALYNSENRDIESMLRARYRTIRVDASNDRTQSCTAVVSAAMTLLADHIRRDTSLLRSL
ncbi:nucleoside monophosphate kinase [Nocardia sp. NPDC056000]|uniref:nucleoside monophosphate kinase n=1 Tax=Nocardia sp. NPDC056000 TaxID=3345674 RepID=UPI0035DAD0CF